MEARETIINDLDQSIFDQSSMDDFYTNYNGDQAVFPNFTKKNNGTSKENSVQNYFCCRKFFYYK